jgi:hypothetical protein
LIENYKSKKLSTHEIILKSSLVEIIIAMGISFKIVKKYFVKKQQSTSEFL